MTSEKSPNFFNNRFSWLVLRPNVAADAKKYKNKIEPLRISLSQNVITHEHNGTFCLCISLAMVGFLQHFLAQIQHLTIRA